MASSQRIFLGLGSNLGNRSRNISKGLAELNKFSELKATSFLYKTKPMYITDQPAFYNAVCEIETSLGPLELLQRIKKIEEDLGRQAGIRYGPRPLDLDILFYGDSKVKIDQKLVIPHPRITEREFVLRPLCDIDPQVGSDLLGNSPQFFLGELEKKTSKEDYAVPITPVGDKELIWGSKTYSMGVLNVTPDSFSDGGTFYTLDSALNRAERMIAAGFDIIDIGGQSTRPHAKYLDAAEESKRVVPVVEHIRKAFPEVLISIDTFHSSVAKECVTAGTNIINDVSAGSIDPDIYLVALDMNVPYIAMHMRGTPQTMMKMTNYTNGGVVKSIVEELKLSVHKLQEHGFPRWLLITDPGIGFAKNLKDNMEILRNLKTIKAALYNYPMLIGPSRKKFLGTLLGKEESQPADRDWATAAVVGAAIGQGVDIVRFHNEKILDVVKTTDHIIRYGV